MDEHDWLADRYETSRPRLRAMAYRMLGSLSDAEDAVQEAWIHAVGADAESVDNLEGWFTTIVARVCLDMLRSRKSRREEPLEVEDAATGSGPEQEAVLADSVGLALLVVLDTMAPAERVAFVLHDTFGLPFDEIAAITGRTPAAARQLASRARRRVRGAPAVPEARLARQREVAEAFLAASRGGDLGALLAVLDPDAEFHADAGASLTGAPTTVRGAMAVAGGARASSGRARQSEVALINGTPGLVWVPGGRLSLVLLFTIPDGLITRVEAITDPERLAELEIAVWS
jgi:RNA polymerase sigma factor (sigma-70 family)